MSWLRLTWRSHRSRSDASVFKPVSTTRPHAQTTSENSHLSKTLCSDIRHVFSTQTLIFWPMSQLNSIFKALTTQTSLRSRLLRTATTLMSMVLSHRHLRMSTWILYLTMRLFLSWFCFAVTWRECADGYLQANLTAFQWRCSLLDRHSSLICLLYTMKHQMNLLQSYAAH